MAIDVSKDNPHDTGDNKMSYSGIVHRYALQYTTKFDYMWGAIAATLFCILLVLLVYWGFWEMGRKVELTNQRTLQE